MTNIKTIATINDYLDEQPGDWQARLELADLLEEVSRNDEARYQRWAVKFRKRPEHLRHTTLMPWHWFVGNEFTQASLGPLATRIRAYYSGHSNRQAAEDALLQRLMFENWPAPGDKYDRS